MQVLSRSSLRDAVSRSAGSTEEHGEAVKGTKGTKGRACVTYIGTVLRRPDQFDLTARRDVAESPYTACSKRYTIHGWRTIAQHAVPQQYSIFGFYGLSTAHTAGQRYTKPWSCCATCSLVSVRSHDSRSRKGRLVTRRPLSDSKQPRRLRALGSGSRQAASQGLSYICFDG